MSNYRDIATVGQFFQSSNLDAKKRLLLEDKTLAKDMGENGHKFIDETFNLNVVAKNFIKIVQSYLK